MEATVVNAASSAGTPRRNRRAQQAGHSLKLGVTRLARASGRNELTDAYAAAHRSPDLEHYASRGVAKRQILGEPAPNSLCRRGDAVGSSLAHHLTDQIRPSPRLGEQARLCQRGKRPLSARGDHRRHRPHEHFGRPGGRAGDVEHFDWPAGNRLDDILHITPSVLATPEKPWA